MALLDIRQRTGYLFVALTVGHIVLISAQVTTNRGIPLLEEVTFGAFAEVQRIASTAIGGMRTSWTDYVALQEVRSENARLRDEVARLRVGLQQERALAQRARSLEGILELRTSVELATVAAQQRHPNGKSAVVEMSGEPGDGLGRIARPVNHENTVLGGARKIDATRADDHAVGAKRASHALTPLEGFWVDGASRGRRDKQGESWQHP